MTKAMVSVLLVLWAVCAILAGSAAASTMKIMSFNIDCRVCDLHHENGEHWRDRVNNVKDTIARHDPDLIGIQEPIFKLDVQQLLPKGYGAVYFNQTSWLPWGVYPDAVLFYRESRFEALDFHMFWLGPNSSFPAGFDRGALPRLAIYSLFRDKSDQSLFHFGSTHFDHGDDLEGKNVDCVESAKELLSFTSKEVNQFPFIWTGDFNSETANNNAYAILSNQSAAVHLDDSYYKSPTHTVAYNTEAAPEYDYNHSIDHIFFANNFDVASYTPLDWTVDMYVYGEKAQYASDHWAIVSTIEVKTL
jgi:endonuclease/exonuclease/phosphatase family metal-dependent hydrolase